MNGDEGLVPLFTRVIIPKYSCSQNYFDDRLNTLVEV